MRAIVSLVLPLVFTALVVFLIGCGLPSTPASDNGLRYDPSGSDRDCGDFRNWKEPRPFMKPLMDSQRTSTGWTVIETASRVSPCLGHLSVGSPMSNFHDHRCPECGIIWRHGVFGCAYGTGYLKSLAAGCPLPVLSTHSFRG